jgi:CelD/BcsL family acetyltransferase involved in cellulose biosynthesis
MNVTIISTVEGFHSLRDEWNYLLENSKQKTIFLTWEWLYTWWQVYKCESQQLHICTVRDQGQLTGIAPLYIKKRYLTSVIYFLGSNIVCSDYLDFILLKTREEKSLFAIIDSIIKENDKWDVLSLRNIPADSNNIPLIRSCFLVNRTIFDEINTVCPYLNLQSNWESIYATFSPMLKNIINKKFRKINKLHNIQYVEASPGKDIVSMFSRFIQLNRLRFKMKGKQSPFADKKFLEFHNHIIAVLNGRDMIKIAFLKADDELIAGIYLFKYNDKYLYYQGGFDPAWESFSPGTLLSYFVIKDAHERKMKELDFLQGNEDYKRNWTRTTRYNARINIYNQNITSQLIYWYDIIRRQFIIISKYIKSRCSFN